MAFVTLHHLYKQYGDYLATNDVSLAIPAGTIYGLLGPNGAGKTTLIRMITRIIYPDKGEVRLGGELLAERHTQLIGYMPEERGLYKTMRVFEHLIYLARLKGLSATEAKKKVNYWLEKFEIQQWSNKKIEELSKGMAQKIQFIATIIHDPQLLILDEPFSGLDPINARLIEAEIYALKEQGKTIIFSTHRMEQVEEICNEIVLINKGKKVLEGGVASLKQQYKENKYRVLYEGQLPADFAMHYPIISHSQNEIIVTTVGDSNVLLQYLLQHQILVKGYQEILPSLSELFIKAVADE
jgi:ABC-2 type transport system ATP-binding protein